ncbi:MAG TPA: hypothetical protein VF278_20620 [Pirellulales bacterium]
MSQGFNAYREWLGIASQSDIPSYYELLGLRPLEPDTAQIEAAYQRQSARLTAQLAGGQADVAQRLLGEIAEARLTLLTPTAKRAYDTALATTIASTAPAASSNPPVEMPAAPAAMPSQPVAAYPAMPQAVQGQQPAASYGYPGGYPAAQAMNPAYPAPQAYPGWQGQPAMPVAAAGYYPNAYPAAAPMAAAPQPAVEEPSMPAIRRRRTRRRSSPVPAVIGVLGVLVVLGGAWAFYNSGAPAPTDDGNQPSTTNGGAAQRAKRIAMLRPDSAPADATPDTATVKSHSSPGVTGDTNRNQPATATGANDDTKMSPPNARPPEAPPAAPAPPEKPPAAKPAAEMAAPAKPVIDKPEPEKPASEKPAPEKPASEKPAPEKPTEEPAEAKATAEEAAKVAELLKSARAALAGRDIAKAQDLLAEATIEATAPDTTADVGRVELLASYVEMFWDAVRQTLPKLGLEELEINGTMAAVVESDENHLVIRAEGKTHEYQWQRLPRSIAYYLANRWLAPDDPVRNLVLASFEIVDPKGDRGHAESLLSDAASAGLKSDSLQAELKLARGK